MARVIVMGIAAGLLAVAAAGPAVAQVAGPQERQAILDRTPKCEEHPDYPIIGRISGGAEDIDDRGIYLTFVGCFPSVAACEAWKGPISGLITSTIVENSCRPRG